MPYKLNYLSRFFFVFLFAFTSPVYAESYDNFSCENDEEINLSLPIGTGGWGSVVALTDNNPWSVWSANYPGMATATIDLGSVATISKISLFENVFLPGSGIVEIRLIKSDGSSQTIPIDLEGSIAQNQWHNESNLNIQNVDKVVFIRNQASENVSELKLCKKQNIVSGCTFNKDSNFQDCLPWDAMTGVNDDQTVYVDQMMYKRWRPQVVHKSPNTQINSVDIATYGHENGHVNNTNCFARHDRYWTLGDDGYAYHTWHPADDGVCTYLHEHGDNPNPTDLSIVGDQYLDTKTGLKRKSQAFEYAKGVYGSGYPPFGYAMSVYNRTHNKKRGEDHFGHKVVVANSIRMAIGEPQNIGTDIYDTGIRCDWYSKMHQGSYSADAMTNNIHEYFLNLVCNDDGSAPFVDDIDAQRADVTKISFKTMLNWGNPYLIKEVGGGVSFEAYVPISNPTSQPDFITVWDAVAANNNYSTHNPVASLLTKVWGGIDPIPSLDTKPTVVNGIPLDFAESGSRDFEFFSGFMSKNKWDQWITNASNYDDDGISAPELWSGPSGNDFKIANEGSLKFAPYYIVKNPSRMLSTNPNNGQLELARTVELCKNAPKKAFCGEIDNNSDWKTSTFFNGSVRALNFKAINLHNPNGPTSWCSDAIGENPTIVNNTNQCNNTLTQIRQKASSIDNGWQGYGNSEGTICEKGSNPSHCGEAIVGTIERWSIDYDSQSKLWTTHRKKAKQDGDSSHYYGAGMGFEWIINHGNDVGVRVPN